MALSKPVLIIGGGISGLALAQALKKQGIPYRIFERDAGPDHRSQGWSITLHFCLEPLKNSIDPILYETLPAKASVNPRDPQIEFALVDGQSLETLVRFDQQAQFVSYRINRVRFRQWLLTGIDMEWNKLFQSYDVNEHGVTVTFKDGTKVEGSLLVGADGVNSGVCRQLVGSEQFSNTTTLNPLRILGASRWVDKETYEIYRPFASTQILSHGRLENGEVVRLFITVNDISEDGERYEMLWALSRYDPKDLLPHENTSEGRLKQAKDWSNAFRGVLRQLIWDTPSDTLVTDLKIRERSPSEDIRSNSGDGRVTLVGDAAHTMTMSRGEGGNHAILDSTMLVAQLAEVNQGKKSLSDAVDTYLDEMIPRGSKAVLESHQAAEMGHEHPDRVVEMLKSRVKEYMLKVNNK
ncbi:hypothetical protein EC973_005030 [Apophysomyces ossiformis]|uniref:FAD-binding domain-containing protein n=1 Tax=Apophysomyces ossiformis TaxID=679940 RepID=A0A8H7BRW2_9FUNG|nr:hypothetical protein EC973_005030 [Apophysomyces ossiformis]